MFCAAASTPVDALCAAMRQFAERVCAGLDHPDHSTEQ